MSYSTFGELPDDMPIGSAEFPIELTECPDNGLVLYREFDEAEVPVLAQIVRSPEYQSLRQAETPYYRAYHLATTMKEDMRDRAGLLLAATWQAKNGSNTEQARRYNEEFVALATQAVTDVSLPSLVIRARATNVLREVRRFKDAEALRSLLQRFSEPNEGDSEDEAAERSGLGRYLDRLAAPIARNDASRAPIDMLGLRVATERCLAASAPEGEPLTSFENPSATRLKSQTLWPSFVNNDRSWIPWSATLPKSVLRGADSPLKHQSPPRPSPPRSPG